MKCSLEQFLGIKIAADHKALTWLVGWAAMSINIARRGPDGRTAWELRHGKRFHRKVGLFGEHVMYLNVRKSPGLHDRWYHGCFLGLAMKSDNVIVSDADGDITVARSFRRLPEAIARDAELFNKIRGTPWCPVVRQRV
eukprot:6031459-Karenia_brevis.AAC.1